jgi:hypothetical protein
MAKEMIKCQAPGRLQRTRPAAACHLAGGWGLAECRKLEAQTIEQTVGGLRLVG